MTVYTNHADRWDEIAKTTPCVSEMAKHFATIRDMEFAMGYTSSTIIKWVNGQNRVSNHSEAIARAWLSRPPTVASAVPVEQPAQSMLRIVCDPAKAEKVQKVLALMGCEAVEV